MAYIKVNYRKIEKAASAVDDYVELMGTKIKSAQKEVTALSSAWQGKDYTRFKSEFSKVDNKGSTHDEMMTSLDSYANRLRFAAKKYKEAQSRAINRANNLPRW